MKKILTVLAIAALGMQLASAQSAIVKEIEKAEAATQDAKKAAKVATWTKLGDAYFKAYQAPTANIPSMGVSTTELQLLMGNTKPVSVKTVELGGVQYEMQSFKDKDLYFSNGRLAFVDVTKPVLGKKDALEGVFKAYQKAGEVDVKGSKKKDVTKMIGEVDQNYFNDAYTAYLVGDKKKASDLFLKAGNVSLSQFAPKVDTSAFFNAGLAAYEAGDVDKAIECYKLALKNGYAETSKGGIYSSLASVYMEKKDTVTAKQFLEDGFKVYPNNAQIMTDLINIYLWTKDDPEKIIVLLDKAKEQMPDNAGLYDVEGDIWKNLGKRDKALEAYAKSHEVNPKGDYPYYAEGRLYCDWYNAIDEEKGKVDLKDYKTYDRLDKESKETLQKSIAPLEKCYEITTRSDMKLAVADLLKKVYFQLRGVNPDYMELHKKYDAICKELQSAK